MKRNLILFGLLVSFLVLLSTSGTRAQDTAEEVESGEGSKEEEGTTDDEWLVSDEDNTDQDEDNEDADETQDSAETGDETEDNSEESSEAEDPESEDTGVGEKESEKKVLLGKDQPIQINIQPVDDPEICVGKADGVQLEREPSSCLYFIICINKQAHKLDCPAIPNQLYFDPIKRTCSDVSETYCQEVDVDALLKEEEAKEEGDAETSPLEDVDEEETDGKVEL